MQLQDVFRLSPLLATHPRSPQGVRCHSFPLVAFFPRSLVTCYQIQVLSFQTLADSFALVQNPTLLFSNDSGLFRKNTRGWCRGTTNTQLAPSNLIDVSL